jgi:integrase
MKDKAGSVSKYLTKTGKRLWRYRFDGDPFDGKRNVISKQGFATRSVAMDALRIAIDGYREGKFVAPPAPPPKETCADWVRAWLRDYAPQRCSPKTIERYHQLAAYVLDAREGEPAKLAAAPLVEVDHVLVEAAIYSLLRMPAKRRKHLSAKTVREIAGVLSVSLNKAFRLGKINLNPLLRVELPKVEKSDARSLTLDELQQLRNACRGDWTFPFIEVAAATGARRGEMLALEWSDIDWLNSTVHVSKSLEQTAAGLRIKRPKNGKARKFRVGQSAIAALRFQQDHQAEHRKLYGPDYKNNLVFSQPDGSYLWPHLVSQAIVRRMRKAGIKDASLHSLRHSHASGLLSKGVPLPAVSARLGHADTNITARIYSHALPDDDNRAADTWESIVRGPVQ